MSLDPDKLFAQSTSPSPSSENSEEEGDQTILNISTSLRPSSPTSSNLNLSRLFNPTPSPPMNPNPSSNLNPTMSTSINPNEYSPQQQAIILNQSLARSIKILTDDNYMLWASFIRTGLKSMFLSEYLRSDDIKLENSQFSDEVSRTCITNWILNNMDDVNRSRFEPKITIYNDDGPETQDLPSKLWKAITSHHSSRSEELRLLLERALNLLVQGSNVPLLTHLQNFQDAVTKYKTAGGQFKKFIDPKKDF